MIENNGFGKTIIQEIPTQEMDDSVMAFSLNPEQRSQMNPNSMKRRILFARWSSGKMNDESFLRCDKLLAGEGRNQNIENINNALKHIGRESFVVYDLTNVDELEDIWKECRQYKKEVLRTSGSNAPSAAVGLYIKFLKGG